MSLLTVRFGGFTMGYILTISCIKAAIVPAWE